MSVADKVQSRHCDRLAIVYVRQSTLQQVERHQESTRLQYGLVERAFQFGWSRERVVVIDDDLGRSGAAAAMNPGFQRLVAEVGLDDGWLNSDLFSRERLLAELQDFLNEWTNLQQVHQDFKIVISDLQSLLGGFRGWLEQIELGIR